MSIADDLPSSGTDEVSPFLRALRGQRSFRLSTEVTEVTEELVLRSQCVCREGRTNRGSQCRASSRLQPDAVGPAWLRLPLGIVRFHMFQTTITLHLKPDTRLSTLGKKPSRDQNDAFFCP